MSFGKRLKSIRTGKKLTANEVARLAGVPASSYQEWEQGRRIRDIEVYLKLAQTLDVSLSELVLGNRKPEGIESALAQIDGAIESLRVAKKILVSVAI